MQRKAISIALPIVIGIISLTIGWCGRAAAPLSAQGIVVDGRATFSGPTSPNAPAGILESLTYQGRLLSSSGVPVNYMVTMSFRIYSDTNNIAIWTSATRAITPSNGLFTVYLGDNGDPLLSNLVLKQAASIGVTVGSDPEMTPRQYLNSIVGHSRNDVGVLGSSGNSSGVLGISNSGAGMSGISKSGEGVTGVSVSGPGVIGQSTTHYGVNGGSDSSDGVAGISNSGSGVYGISNTGSGVYGYSSSNIFAGVQGQNDSGTGVVGKSYLSSGVQGSSTLGFGVSGFTSVITRAGVLAQNSVPAGPALQIDGGGIKATGAGIGSNTFAFIHESTNANIFNNTTRIDNVLTNGDQAAMLFVTHVNNPTSVAPNTFNKAFGVYYDSGSSQWTIYVEDNSAFPSGTTFNVMVIKR